MLGTSIAQSKEYKSEITSDSCPNCEDIIFKFIKLAAIFLITKRLFIVSLTDIRGYMEDHNINFGNYDSFALLVILVLVYVIPKLISIIKGWNNIRNFYAIGIGLFLAAIVLMSYVFPWLTPTQLDERDALWLTVSIWLLSIFLINIVLDKAFLDYILRKPRALLSEEIKKILERHANE